MINTQYNPIDVANYIICYAQVKNQNVTHLKLQKILYYVVARYLQETNNRLIDEPIAKWLYGPVIKSVYHQFKIFGSMPITEPLEYLLATNQNNPFAIEWSNVQEEREKILRNKEFVKISTCVLDQLIEMDTFELVEITHQESAWQNYEREILAGHELFYTEEELRKASYVR